MKNGLGQSMSRRGNCWDNAPQESFFGHLKDHIDNRSCTSLNDLQREIDRYIRYYNNHRYQCTGITSCWLPKYSKALFFKCP